MRKVLISSMLANSLEWYDFVLYVQFSNILSKLFFPSDDHFSSLLAVFAVFAVGFVMRPIGGIFFGLIGDRVGRKVALVSSILMMAIPTTLIGLLPTFSQIGIWAPILLTIIRLLQGMALGGGFSGLMTFIVEHAPSDKKALFGSSSMFSLGSGVFLGIIVSLLFKLGLDETSFNSWGWRIPFLLSAFMGIVAFYIKKNISESPEYLDNLKQNIAKPSLKEFFKLYRKELLLATALYLTVTVPFYSFTAFFSSYLQKYLSYSATTTLKMNAVITLFFMLAIGISGYLSDRFGKKFILIISAVAIALTSPLCFILMNQGGILYPLIGQIIFAAAVGCYMAPIPATLVELFPINVRFTGLALSYNFSAAVFGGTTPYILLEIISRSNNLYAPIAYIILFVIITLYAIKHFKQLIK